MTKKLLLISTSTIAAVIFLTWLGLYIWLLATPAPLNHPLVGIPVWPVACTTRGCITSATWVSYHELMNTFAHISEQEEPSPEASLTTAVRRHLVSHAFLRSPVTLKDARRYREEILKITRDDQLQGVVPVSIPTYDKEVVLPLLQQEALRQQNSVESTEELYKTLTEDRPVVILPFVFQWNSDTGSVVRK